MLTHQFGWRSIFLANVPFGLAVIAAMLWGLRAEWAEARGEKLGMGITMLIFALTVGRVEITPEYHPLFLTAVKAAFAIFAAISAVGVFASLARGKVR